MIRIDSAASSNCVTMQSAFAVILGDEKAAESDVPTSLVDFVADADATLNAAKLSILQSSPSKQSLVSSDDASCFTAMTEKEQDVAKMLELTDFDNLVQTTNTSAPSAVEPKNMRPQSRTTTEEAGSISVSARGDWLESLGTTVMRLPSSLLIYRGEIICEVRRRLRQRSKDDTLSLHASVLHEASGRIASSESTEGSKAKLSFSAMTESESGSEIDVTTTEKIGYSSPPSVQKTSSASSVAASDDEWNDDKRLKDRRNIRLRKCVGACTLAFLVISIASVLGAVMSHAKKNSSAPADSTTGVDPFGTEYINIVSFPSDVRNCYLSRNFDIVSLIRQS